MIKLNKLHHIAIICSDYEKSKYFYTQILGFRIECEHYRKDRDSYKLDLSLNHSYIIELFSFANPPQRVTQPEAAGLRHIAFEVDAIERTIAQLTSNGIVCEPVRTDKLTGRKFTFFADPDNLPIELYEK